MSTAYKHNSLSLDDLADPTAVIDEVAGQLEDLAHPTSACVSVLCRVRAGRKVLDQLPTPRRTQGGSESRFHVDGATYGEAGGGAEVLGKSVE